MKDERGRWDDERQGSGKREWGEHLERRAEESRHRETPRRLGETWDQGRDTRGMETRKKKIEMQANQERSLRRQ